MTQPTQKKTSAAAETSGPSPEVKPIRETSPEADVKLCQYQGRLLNMPAGPQTERCIIDTPKFRGREFINPRDIENFLAADRRELGSVAALLTEKTGQTFTSAQALTTIGRRMYDLMMGAGKVLRGIDQSIDRLKILAHSGPVDLESRSMKFKRFLWKMGDHHFPFEMGYGISELGGRKYSSYAKPKNKDDMSLQTNAKAAFETLCHFDLNGGRMPPEAIAGMFTALREVAKLAKLPEETFIPPSGLENGRYQVNFISRCSAIRGPDFILDFKKRDGTLSHVRLNTIQLKTALRGIFYKWEHPEPPSDWQHRIYPSSPLEFYRDHMAHLPADDLQKLLKPVSAD